MARADPLTGYLEFIPVSGNFRDAYSLMAIISANPDKPRPINYSMGWENGDAGAFLAFIEYLIGDGWFQHDKTLIMDNAAIHTCDVAEIVPDILWSTVINGCPLHVLVLYFPTRSPELNPIELIFHILAWRIRSFKYQYAGPIDSAVLLKKSMEVMDEMSYGLILRCYIHCGY